MDEKEIFMNIIERIKSALKEKKIDIYRINMIEKESIELFYILHDVDMARSAEITEISVIVYRDFEYENTKMRGNAATLIFPDMTDEEIEKALENAYYSAGFVKNKYYELPEGKEYDEIDATCYDLQIEAENMAKAIFSAEEDMCVKNSSAFINSAEVFAYRSKIRIVNSKGVDVSYYKYSFEGEFVAESKANGQDVEIHTEFSYNVPDVSQLSAKVSVALKTVKDRAEATLAPKAGKYDIVLTDIPCATMLSYYTARSSGAYIYAGYSSFSIGNAVQGEDVIGEKLNIKLKAVSPFSAEGIKMENRVLMENGVLKTIPCGSRFAYYLGVEPTGDYDFIECENGTIDYECMKENTLQIAAFSDFQVDPLSGQFGGEIRLAYFYEKKENGYEIKKLTGGSINGNIIEAGKDLIFSTQRYKDKNYDVPYAIKIKNVSVAGE